MGIAGAAFVLFAGAMEGNATAQGRQDHLVVVSKLDFSVEEVEPSYPQGSPIAFRVILPRSGVLRAQVQSWLVEEASKEAVFQETMLYDASTWGDRHLVTIDTGQVPRAGTYALRIQVAGIRSGESDKPVPFELEKQFPLAIVAATTETPKIAGPRRLEARIHFDVDSFLVGADAQPQIERAADAYRKAGNGALLLVEGHADATGSPGHNLDLSLKRALEVKKALVKAGVPARQVRTSGYGSTRPMEGSLAKGADARNRRAEFLLVQAPGTQE